MTLRNKRPAKAKARKARPVAPAPDPGTDNSLEYGAEIGALRFRKPFYPTEFAGPKGTPVPAGILDLDGTLYDWGSSASTTVLDWMKTVEARHPHMVWLVVSARTHQHDFSRSFNWLLRQPFAFVGPFCRAEDDPRYASEFKREVAQGFEDMGLYRIVAAADDNQFVLSMWAHWAQTHFADPADFDILKCAYTPYTAWRDALPTKTTYYGAYGGRYESAYPPVSSSVPAPQRTDDSWGWGDYDQWEAVGSSTPRLTDAECDRWELEEELYANTEMTRHEIAVMDIEVLKDLVTRYDQPETGPLDVAEIFEEMGEKPYLQDQEEVA